jgi:thiamine biosynthesis protein ThiS
MDENNYDFIGIIVKVNEALIEEEAWEHTAVSAGDKVDIIHIFGGG